MYTPTGLVHCVLEEHAGGVSAIHPPGRADSCGFRAVCLCWGNFGLYFKCLYRYLQAREYIYGKVNGLGLFSGIGIKLVVLI